MVQCEKNFVLRPVSELEEVVEVCYQIERANLGSADLYLSLC
jgi:hypothetical protein